MVIAISRGAEFHAKPTLAHSSDPPRMEAWKPVVTASEVAAAIGRNCFVPRDAAFLGILRKDPAWAGVVSAAQAELRAATPREVLQRVSAVHGAVGGLLEAAIRDADAASDARDVRAAALRAVDAVTRIAFPTATADNHAARQALADGVVDAVHAARGIKGEAPALDRVAAAARTPVTQRSAATHVLETDEYRIVGRIDGFIPATCTIVEAKRKSHPLAARYPPQEHEVIQCRVYARLLREAHPGVRALLVETIVDGSTRESPVADDDDAWAAIDAALRERVCALLRGLTVGDVRDLVRDNLRVLEPSHPAVARRA